MKKRIALMLLPLLALTSCSGKTLTKEEAIETVNQIRMNSVQAQEEVDGYTYKSSYYINIKSETDNGYSEESLIIAYSKERSYYRLTLLSDVDFENESGKQEYQQSTTQWIYLDKATNEFVIALENIIVDKQDEEANKSIRGYYKIPNVIPLDEILGDLDVSTATPDDMIQDTSLGELLEVFDYNVEIEFAGMGASLNYNVSSKGEGHIKLNASILLDYTDEEGKIDTSIKYVEEYNNYLFSSRNINLKHEISDEQGRVFYSDNTKSSESLSLKASISYPNLNNFEEVSFTA